MTADGRGHYATSTQTVGGPGGLAFDPGLAAALDQDVAAGRAGGLPPAGDQEQVDGGGSRPTRRRPGERQRAPLRRGGVAEDQGAEQEGGSPEHFSACPPETITHWPGASCLMLFGVETSASQPTSAARQNHHT